MPILNINKTLRKLGFFTSYEGALLPSVTSERHQIADMASNHNCSAKRRRLEYDQHDGPLLRPNTSAPSNPWESWSGRESEVPTSRIEDGEFPQRNVLPPPLGTSGFIGHLPRSSEQDTAVWSNSDVEQSFSCFGMVFCLH